MYIHVNMIVCSMAIIVWIIITAYMKIIYSLNMEA